MLNKLLNIFNSDKPTDLSRRSFLKKSTAVAVVTSVGGITALYQKPIFSIETATLVNADFLRFNVLHYGADPTGILDSATAFQNAIDDAVSASYRDRDNIVQIYVPNGTFRIQAPIFSYNGHLVSGASNRI